MSEDGALELEARLLDYITKDMKAIESNVKRSAIQMQSGFKSMEQVMGGAATAAKGLGIGVGVVAGGFWAVDKSLKALTLDYRMQIEAEGRLTAALGKTSPRLVALGSQLQEITTYADDVSISAAAMMGNFIASEDVIASLLPLVQDFAAAKKMDLVSAADLVTKTLASETSALGRYGIKVEGAVGSQRRLESITRGLASAFKGQAQALAQTDTGKLDQLTNKLSDLKEEIGKNLMPVMIGWNVLINETLEGWLDLLAISDQGKIKKMQDNIDRLENQLAALDGKKFNLTSLLTFGMDKKVIAEQKEGVERELEKARTELLEFMNKKYERPKTTNNKPGTDAINYLKNGIAPEAADPFAGIEDIYDLQLENRKKFFDEIGAVDIEEINKMKLRISEGIFTEEITRAQADGLNQALESRRTQLLSMREIEQAMAQDSITNYERLYQAIGQLREQDYLSEYAYTDLLEDLSKKRQAQLQNEAEMRARQWESMASFASDSVNKMNGIISDMLSLSEKENERTRGIRITQAIISGAMAVVDGIRLAYSSSSTSAGAAVQAIANSAMVLASVGVQIAKIRSAKGYEGGGVIPGTSYSGDNVLARVNSGELILNRGQQANILMAIASGRLGGTDARQIHLHLSVPPGTSVDSASAARMELSVQQLIPVLMRAENEGRLDAFKRRVQR